MKTYVEILYDSRYGDYKKGEVGFIDGYCQGADNCAYAMVVVGEFIQMVEPRNLKVITK